MSFFLSLKTDAMKRPRAKRGATLQSAASRLSLLRARGADCSLDGRFRLFRTVWGCQLLLGVIVNGALAVRGCGDAVTTTSNAAMPISLIVEIGGFVEFQQRPAGVNYGRWQRTPFQIRIRGSNWLARLVPSNGSFVDYTEIGSDGVDCYWLDCYKSFVEKAQREGRKTGTNVAAATVRASPVPFSQLTHQIGAIWLTYASAFYFDRLTKPVAESPITHREGAIRFFDDYSLQPIVFERFDTPLTLNVPKSITYFDRWIDPHETVRSIHRSAITNLPVNADFKVLEVTNCQGLAVALSSRLIHHIRLPIPSEVTIHEYLVQTTNVTVLPDGPFDPRPAIVGVTLFTDGRFNTGNGLRFNYLAERWLDREAVKKLPEYKRAKVLADSTARFKARGKHFKFFLLAFISLVGVPLLVFLWRQLSGPDMRSHSPHGTSA